MYNKEYKGGKEGREEIFSYKEGKLHKIITKGIRGIVLWAYL